MTARYPILIVDDDASVVDVLVRAASSVFAEAQFIAIHNFEEATAYLDGLRGPGPRLVLLDVNLQTDMTGLDYITRLRQHPQGRYVPIVVLSTEENPAKIREAYRRGANAFTYKPDRYQDWKAYVEVIRNYWCKAVTTPQLWFDKEESVERKSSAK